VATIIALTGGGGAGEPPDVSAPVPAGPSVAPPSPAPAPDGELQAEAVRASHLARVRQPHLARMPPPRTGIGMAEMRLEGPAALDG
jgi:hypothetical protein